MNMKVEGAQEQTKTTDKASVTGREGTGKKKFSKQKHLNGKQLLKTKI